MTHRHDTPNEELAVGPFAPADGMCGVEVEGAADLRGAPALGAAIAEALDGGCRRLVVDLSKATFVDSSCLGTLLGAQRRMRDVGGMIAVVCPDPHLVRIFELTLLDRVFLVCSDRLEAVGRLREPETQGQGHAAVADTRVLPAPLAFDADDGEIAAGDEIRLQLPAASPFATVPRLVLGGIASRFDLPIDRLEELQLAFEAAAVHESALPTIEVLVLASAVGVRVRAGRFAEDPLADAGTRRAVGKLVEHARSGRDEEGHWVELVVHAARRAGNGTERA